MSFLKSNLYKDYGASGDLSDVSEVDADELAAILGEVDSIERNLTGESNDKGRASDKKLEEKESDHGRGDWLGLTESPAVAPSRSQHSVSSSLFPPSTASTGGGAQRSRSGDVGATSGRRDNRQGLIKELFGDSKWASDKGKDSPGLKDPVKRVDEKPVLESKGKSESFGLDLGGGKDRSGTKDDSYVPSTATPRRPRRQPPKPLDIDDFGFSDVLNDGKDDSLTKDVSGLNSGIFRGNSDTVLKETAQFTEPSFPALDHHRSETKTFDTIRSADEVRTTDTLIPGYPSNKIIRTIDTNLSQNVNADSTFYVPNTNNPQEASHSMATGPVYSGMTGQTHSAGQPSHFTGWNQLVHGHPNTMPPAYPQFYPLPPPTAQLTADDGEMVEDLRNAQASFGAALSAHHSKIQSYMQLLLDEARRLSVVAKITNPTESISKKHKTSDDDEETSSRAAARGENVDESEPEYHPEVDKEQRDEELQTDVEITQAVSSQRIESSLLRRQHSLPDEDTSQQMKELKISVQKLEIENSNLLLKLENLKFHHEMEIEFLKKSSVQEALLWESRIERIQQFCYFIEKEYAEKIEKMKINEEELVKSHKARVEALQTDRLSDMQQLSDLHKAVLEQALNSAINLPNFRDRVPRMPAVRSPERPVNEEEMSEREAALIRKERQQEELRLELDDERRRNTESYLERQRAVKEAESTWESRRDAESRELARREARTDELERLVEEMREQALSEAKQLAAEKLKVQTDRARLEAFMKAETGIIANPEHILHMRAEVEAGLEESKEMKSALESERRRIGEEWMRLEARLLEVEARERDLARMRDETAREREDLARERETCLRKRNDAERAEAKAKSREEEAEEKTAHLELQIREIAKERLEVKRDKLEIETAKTRLDILLPELTPNESFTINPPRNYVDPKAIIMRLKAEKELESYVVSPVSTNQFS